jgi:glycosyltransferase involved in cell wall biosynthesis
MAPFTTLPREVARQKIRPSGDSAAPSVAGTFLFFIIAELHKNKCIDIALRAFALVHKKHPNACLVSMGGGEEDKKLRSLAEKLGLANSVTFAGFVPDARIYLSAADCFVLPSCKEGVPLSLLQAGIAHVPAIATNVGGIPEVIENEKTGILVAPRNVKELAGAMEEMMAHPEKRISYGEALYDRVTKDFSEGEMVRKTFECY